MSFLDQIFGSDKQGNKKLNISKLINSDNINESINKIDNYICTVCESGDKLDALTDPQKVFFYIQNLAREIKKGGFSQFYLNSSGDSAHEIYDSLRIIGAYKTANMVMSANDQFPGKAVPKDSSERQKLLEQVQDSANEVWKELDQKFLSQEEDLNAFNIEFIRKNKDFF